MKTLPILILLLIVSTSATCRQVKRDPNTGMIRVLYIGAPFSARGPYIYLNSDPLLSVTPISGNQFGLSQDVVKKAMRLYLPRSKTDLAGKYDVVGLDDCTYVSFTMRFIEWVTSGCRDRGLGIFMGGGSEAFGGAHGFPSWGDTPLVNVMPVQPIPMSEGYARNIVKNPEDEFASRTPWENYEEHNIFRGYNVVEIRPGANQISEIRKTGGGRRDPGWVWWDVGEGRFFASPTGFRGSIGGPSVITSASLSFLDWKHYPDFVCNMVYFSAGLRPPADIALMYRVRERFREIDIQKQLTAGMMEFAARFNADTSAVEKKMDEADEQLEKARGFFVNLELEAALEGTDDTISRLEEAYQLAFEAKETALIWVFFIEWLVVTATALVSGVTLWSLMIRKKMYRKVTSTRLRS